MDHDHDPDSRQRPPATPPEPFDPAGEHLADALRVSFRLLTLVMVLVFAGFLLTGVRTIDPNERGLKVVFGRIEGEPAGAGLTYTWPFPVGRIVTVPSGKQTATLDDFWMAETPETKNLPLKQRPVPTEGLDPSRDGALLTGDRALIHLRLDVTYEITDPVMAETNLQSYEAVLRAAVRRAAVMAAAGQTADAIMLMKEKGTSGKGQTARRSEFLDAAERLAQKRLDDLKAGMRITNITQKELALPLAVLNAYEDARRADSDANKARAAAQHEAVKILNDAAGQKYKVLLGDPEKPMQLTDPDLPREKADAEAYNLIGRYDKAVQDGREKQAADLLEQIGQLLEGNEIGGEAKRIISEAKSQEFGIVQEAAAWVERYRKLADRYKVLGGTLLELELTSTLERLFACDTVEKVVLHSGGQKVILKTSEDQDIVETIRKRIAEKKRQLEQEARMLRGEKD